MNEENSQPYDNEIIRWPGSGSADVASLTVFGNYNKDKLFISDCYSSARWACYRLGYPTVAVELIDKIMYPLFEESVNEYNAQVNSFNAMNNMLALQGLSKDVTGDITGQTVNSTGLQRITIIARDYGSEAGSGGNIDWKMASFQVQPGVQEYDLQALIGDKLENCNRIEIKRVFHDRPPAFARIYDPMSMTGMSYSNVITELGFGAYSPATQYLMCPIFEDLLRGQAIQFNDMVRKSAYSFAVVNNKIKLFPIPDGGYNCHIQYTTDKLKLESGALGGKGDNVITDMADIPYSVHPYSTINDASKQWIRKYFLANCKEVLGCIRQKYQTIAIPGSETTLDGAELRSEAQQEKQLLIDNLKELLEQSGKFSQMEKMTAFNTQVQDNLKNVPLGIYIF